MTRTTNARIAGVAYLLYIAVAYPSMVLSNRATAGASMAAKLASIAQHAADVRLAVVLSMLGGMCALALAVTLYAITRDQDRDLAMLGFACRVTEGATGAASLPLMLGLLSLATATGANAPNAAAAEAVTAFVLNQPWLIGATFFAVGSTIFSWLLLRGRMVPVWLAWLGVIGSALIAVGLPLELLDVLGGLPTQLIWIPVAVFELVLAVWLIVKGAAAPPGETQ
ncbi:MAG: DUF4386 domain-containing protein [Gemmatimonadetes bacterium]|nr:MAG: hypothetical protein AUI86_05755 [Gemmatimonadetes bacterium 13_1_40CM_3_66_12]OLD86975.1 MAG: hypothetical protein AUG85_08500 [Gemmatimonadetes bacterium 13_1_20CM_4_66_11]PYP94836.1 MAG: DUF4386 domain-containing protein [Gemmatimonadota bacterium]